MAVFWRVWATTAGVILAVLLVFLALSTFQFSRVHSSLVGERLVVLAKRTAGPFQAAARLGLPIGDVRNATGILERARQTDERIAAIYVFDATGMIVHATLGEPGQGPSVAAARARTLADDNWHSEIQEGFVAGVNIARASGDPAGGIAVLYPRDGNTTRVWAMAAELSVSTVGIFSLGALLAGLLLRLGLRSTISAFDRVETEILDFEKATWHGTDESLSPGGLRADLDTAFARYRAARTELQRHSDVRRQ